MGFVRRYSTFPSQQVISQIEGVVIVDQTPPSPINGVSTGVVGLVGEFADLRYAVSVDGNGNVTTKVQPVEVTSAQDMLNKVGGFDPTLGDFGGADGNGFAAATNKIWARLVLAPINLASTKGVRLFRQLPTCKSATNADPIKPMQAASVPAGYTFKIGNDRVKLGTAISFTADGPTEQGIDGVLAAGGSATRHSFTAAGASFTTTARVGDALVVGKLGTHTGAGTYRIEEVVSDTSLVIEQQDGAAFTTTAQTGVPYRVHPAATADTGGETTLANDSGFLLPARPLDAAIDAATVLQPLIAPPTPTASAWDPLAGLSMSTMWTSGNGLTYDAAVQAANVTGDGLDGAYTAALDALLADLSPARDVSIVFCARVTEAIHNALVQHVLAASASGVGRVACLAPPLTTTDRDTVLGNTYPGVGAVRNERVLYSWPGVQTKIAQAENVRIKLADGTYSSSGRIDVRADSYLASVLSNLAAERNPGQSLDPIPQCLASVLSFQSGNLPDFNMGDYVLFRQNGVVALRFDRVTGKVFQSGVTTSLIPGQKNINRRRFADEVQDSLAAAYAPLTKLPLTSQLKAQITSSTVAYLEGLRSPGNPSAQRIEAYEVDSVSGNTLELQAQGIYVVIVRVQMLGLSDNIVLQAEVGPSVTITAQ